jgi:deoxyadenosine/deoxycytidine kinase
VYVAIAGNIGAGKSTLTRLLADRYALTPVMEAVDENPYLEDFYRSMDSYAFQSQVFFLAARLQQHLTLINPVEHLVQDRTIDEDAEVFARALFESGVMNGRDYAVYRRLYTAIAPSLRPPDLLIYVRASLPTLKAHIRERGRSFEASIDDAYLQQLSALYEDWIATYTRAPVVVVDADALDLRRASDREAVFAAVEQAGFNLPLLAAGRAP